MVFVDIEKPVVEMHIHTCQVELCQEIEPPQVTLAVRPVVDLSARGITRFDASAPGPPQPTFLNRKTIWGCLSNDYLAVGTVVACPRSTNGARLKQKSSCCAQK